MAKKMDLRDILTKVSDARARGISESQINKYLKKKGYNRQRFEDAVLYSIEQDYNNNEYERVAGQKDNPQFWRGVARELTNGMLYEWGDELEAIFRSLVGQETYSDALGQIEDERARFQSIDPTATSLMNLGGSLAGSAMEGGTASKLGLTLPKSLQPVTGQTLRNIPKGATAAAGGGAIAGGITSYGQGSDPMTGMAVGSVASALPTPFIDLGVAATKKVLSGSGDGGTVGPASTSNDYNPNNRALQKVLTSYEDDLGVQGDAAVQAARQNLQDRFVAANRGTEAMLPDLGGRNILKTTDALVSTPGPASEQISEALFQRQAGQRDRILDSAERGMGVGSDPEVFKQQMQQTRKKLSPRYQAIQDDLLQGPQFQQIYQRDPRFAAAQKSIQQNYEFAGEPSTGPIGLGKGKGVRPGPYTVREIEDTRQGVSDMLDRGPVESGYVQGANRRSLTKNYDEMMSAADAESPAYQQLRREGFDTRRMQEMNLMGYKEIPRMPPERLEMIVADKTPAEMDAMRSGFVQRIKDQMNEVKAVAGDRSKDIGSPNMQRRIEILFPTPEQFQQFQREMASEQQMSKTAGYVLGNSRTAERLANQNELGGLSLDDLQSTKLGMAAKGTQMLGDYLQRNNMRQMSEQLGPRMSVQGADAVEKQLMDLQNYAALRDQIAQERARRNMMLGSFGGRVSAGLLDD